MDPKLVTREIGEFIVERVFHNGMQNAVIGLSGGVDSTVAAVLTKIAFDRYNEQNPGQRPLKLKGYILPEYDHRPEDQEDAINLATSIGIDWGVIDIYLIMREARIAMLSLEENKKARGNAASRIRGFILNSEAEVNSAIVIGTGNLDEDAATAYYTLFGDGAVHCHPLGNLPKRLVRELAVFHGQEKAAERTPTAGLEKNQTDFKDLGYSYCLSELMYQALQQGLSQVEVLDHRRVRNLAKREITRYEETFGFQKFTDPGELIIDFLTMKQGIAKTKAEIVHPPAAPVTLEYSEDVALPSEID